MASLTPDVDGERSAQHFSPGIPIAHVWSWNQMADYNARACNVWCAAVNDPSWMDAEHTVIKPILAAILAHLYLA
jgi:hypothetical protein